MVSRSSFDNSRSVLISHVRLFRKTDPSIVTLYMYRNTPSVIIGRNQVCYPSHPFPGMPAHKRIEEPVERDRPGEIETAWHSIRQTQERRRYRLPRQLPSTLRARRSRPHVQSARTWAIQTTAFLFLGCSLKEDRTQNSSRERSTRSALLRTLTSVTTSASTATKYRGLPSRLSTHERTITARCCSMPSCPTCAAFLDRQGYV